MAITAATRQDIIELVVTALECGPRHNVIE